MRKKNGKFYFNAEIKMAQRKMTEIMNCLSLPFLVSNFFLFSSFWNVNIFPAISSLIFLFTIFYYFSSFWNISFHFGNVSFKEIMETPWNGFRLMNGKWTLVVRKKNVPYFFIWELFPKSQLGWVIKNLSSIIQISERAWGIEFQTILLFWML